MKKELKGFVVGFAVCTILSSVVFAKPIEQTITAVYDSIKIYVDGVRIEPKDANGNVVEPFTYNGTTYLPVRAIANAIGKDVEWDSNTNSVYLGKKPDTADATDNSKMVNKYVTITKEGFARKIATLTSAPVEKTNVFSPTDTMYYVFKYDSISTDFVLKFIVKYENEEEIVLLDNYKITRKDAEGKFMHVNITYPEGSKLPTGNYTYKIQGVKDSEVLFEIVDTCKVQWARESGKINWIQKMIDLFPNKTV